MNLVQNLITQGKYGIKCPYEMTPKGICIHNTANDASAKNEIAYMHNNNNEVSFHIAVDNIEAIQGLPLNRNAWHSGDGGSGEGNRNYIAIEICYSKSGGDRFIKAEKNCAILVAQMLKERGWGLDKIKKHQNFSNKYCPHRTLDMGWQRFLNMVQSELDTLNKPILSTPNNTSLYRVRKSWNDVASQIGAYSNLENAKKSCISGYSVFDSKGNKVYPIVVEEYIVKQYAEQGKFTCGVAAIKFSNNPKEVSDTNKATGEYRLNESVNYDLVVVSNKKLYISWISASTKQRRYMAVRDINNGVYGKLLGRII